MALDLSTKTGKHGGNILRPENKWVQTKNITTSRKIYFASATENSISKFHEDQASTRMCERRSPEEREQVSSTLRNTQVQERNEFTRQGRKRSRLPQ